MDSDGHERALNEKTSRVPGVTELTLSITSLSEW